MRDVAVRAAELLNDASELGARHKIAMDELKKAAVREAHMRAALVAILVESRKAVPTRFASTITRLAQGGLEISE